MGNLKGNNWNCCLACRASGKLRREEQLKKKYTIYMINRGALYTNVILFPSLFPLHTKKKNRKRKKVLMKNIACYLKGAALLIGR
jgi:hypothetical protein